MAGRLLFPDIRTPIVSVFFFDKKLHFFDARKSLVLSSQLLQ
ncbi:hypothetical protein ALQ07_102834 [Pseudomonas syringae pv. actinidiae]|uniref:Uncharacterized protein n=1 Tax=Pseudomonas syringae pv. actinidiae TaxID=103796 RepID=A0A3M4KVV8_PSESF|nr:hypothetical protein ALQ07_102834 [Pseudomonas syringae pv. actinidiae]